jgi:hypothetical protein
MYPSPQAPHNTAWHPWRHCRANQQGRGELRQPLTCKSLHAQLLAGLCRLGEHYKLAVTSTRPTTHFLRMKCNFQPVPLSALMCATNARCESTSGHCDRCNAVPWLSFEVHIGFLCRKNTAIRGQQSLGQAMHPRGGAGMELLQRRTCMCSLGTPCSVRSATVAATRRPTPHRPFQVAYGIIARTRVARRLGAWLCGGIGPVTVKAV